MASKKNKLSIIDFYDSEAPESTEIRRVIRNIERYNQEGDKKAIMVTSAMLSEGKSLISAFISMVSAQSRHNKTLLVDFDLRRPMVHKLFNLPMKTGVSDILFNDVSSRLVIKKTALDNLDIITAGEIFSNPSELFNGPAIHKMFEELKFYYDLILVDTPPLLPVMDPMLLLEELDGGLMVVKAGATNRDIIKRASGLINNLRSKVIGVVVNNLSQTLPYYYNYNYYGYHYKSHASAKAPVNKTNKAEVKATSAKKTTIKANSVPPSKK